MRGFVEGMDLLSLWTVPAPEPTGKALNTHFTIREPDGNRSEFSQDPR
jgi:hypothetical protein